MQMLEEKGSDLEKTVENMVHNINDINEAVADSASQTEQLSTSSAKITHQMGQMEDISNKNEFQSSDLYDEIEKIHLLKKSHISIQICGIYIVKTRS